MRTYEVLFILSPQVAEEESTSLINDFRSIGEKTGAKLASEEPWGRRRLAYPIQKFNEGIYHLFVFNSDSSLAELDRRMRNNDRILRHLIVRTDVETQRAVKLAKKNPKKERIRPAVSSPGADLQSTPAAPGASVATTTTTAAEESASPAAPVAAEVQTAPPTAAAPTAPVAEEPEAQSVSPDPSVTETKGDE